MREFDKKMIKAERRLRLKVGDIYESCSYHPVFCLGVDYKGDEIWGISLIDGTYPRACSLVHCGVRKLTPKQAWEIRTCGPDDLDARRKIPLDRRWWNKNTEKNGQEWPVRYVGPRRETTSKQSKKKPRAKKGRAT